jgi:hypothetical protein
MADRFISEPLDDLLQRSGLTPDMVDTSLERLARLGQPTALKPGHAYLRQIHAHSGVDVVGISRRYRRLLVEIEQRKGRELLWRYHERSRSNCVFACPGQIPHTFGAALVGQQLRKLAVPTTTLGAVTIDSVSHADAGWLDVEVTPRWRPF